MRQAGSDTNTAAFWRDLFSNWPEQRPRRGLIITAWLEHIPFDGYLISEAVLFINRPQPDGLNARKVMLPFEQIVAVKFPDVFELEVFESVGFRKKFEREACTVDGREGEHGAVSCLASGAEAIGDHGANGFDGEGTERAEEKLEAATAGDGDVALDGLAELERHVFGDITEQHADTVQVPEGAVTAGESPDRGIQGANAE